MPNGLGEICRFVAPTAAYAAALSTQEGSTWPGDTAFDALYGDPTPALPLSVTALPTADWQSDAALPHLFTRFAA